MRFAREVLALAAVCAACASAAGGGETLGERLERFACDRARLVEAYSNCLARIDRPAKGVIVPVESYASGAVKVDATVERAQFFEKEGIVWCGGVTVREYAEDGAVVLELAAPSGVMDRDTKSGWLEGRATGRQGDTTLSGSGVYFSFPDEFVRVFSGVEITSTAIDFKGVKL